MKISKAVFGILISASMAGAVTAPATSASALTWHCRSNSLITACIAQQGSTIDAKGSGNTGNAVMWLEICRISPGYRCYDVHVGRTAGVRNAPHGTYESTYYFGNGASAIDSPHIRH